MDDLPADVLHGNRPEIRPALLLQTHGHHTVAGPGHTDDLGAIIGSEGSGNFVGGYPGRGGLRRVESDHPLERHPAPDLNLVHPGDSRERAEDVLIEVT